MTSTTVTPLDQPAPNNAEPRSDALRWLDAFHANGGVVTPEFLAANPVGEDIVRNVSFAEIASVNEPDYEAQSEARAARRYAFDADL